MECTVEGVEVFDLGERGDLGGRPESEGAEERVVSVAVGEWEVNLELLRDAGGERGRSLLCFMWGLSLRMKEERRSRRGGDSGTARTSGVETWVGEWGWCCGWGMWWLRKRLRSWRGPCLAGEEEWAGDGRAGGGRGGMGMEAKEGLRVAKRKRERGDSGLVVRRVGCGGTRSGAVRGRTWRGMGTARDAVEDMAVALAVTGKSLVRVAWLAWVWLTIS